MSRVPSVLFVCVHNAGRSQMALGWLRHLAGDRIEARSAGSAPAESLNPVAVAAMQEVGIDIRTATPRLLDATEVQSSDVVITMGCGDTCPVFAGTRYLDWDVADPAGEPIEVVRAIRDELRARVESLLAELSVAPRVEPMRAEHAEAVLAIYRAGIDEGNATFETDVPEWADFDAKRLPQHRFVALHGTDVLGWVAATAVSDRCAYAGVVEHSVYVSPAARGRGVGRLLLRTLVESTEAAGIWTIQSGIFPENEASIALHLSEGFRVIGTRERIGQHHGRWRDVVLLERRSSVV